MSKTLKQLAQDALNVQNACNLCGVAQSFAKAMIDLGDHTKGTDERNRHPVAILWADKIAHLTGTQNLGSDVTSKAYDACYALTNEPDLTHPAVLEALLTNGQ